MSLGPRLRGVSLGLRLGGVSLVLVWYVAWVYRFFHRYLTWDSGKFPSPDVMQDKLALKGRKVRGGASHMTIARK